MKNKNNKNNKVLSHDESANKKIKLKSIDGKDFGEVSVSAFSAIKFGMLDKYSPVDDAEKKNLDAYKQHISARYPDKKEPVSLDKWREETPVISAGGNSSPQKKATPKKTAESRTENTKVNMNSLKFFEDNTPNIFEKYGLNPDTFDRQDFEDWAVRHNFEYANRTGLKYEWLPKLSSDPKKMFDTVATEQDIKDKNVLERFVEEKELVNNAKKHPVISSAKTIVTSPVRSVAAGLALAKDTASTILTGKTNTNDAWHEYVEDADIIRQTVNDEYASKWFDGASGKLGNYGSMVYNGAMSIGDMVTAAATMRALGTAIGLSGNALAAFTSNTTSGLLASNSGASTIIQKKKEGLSDAQSVANGIASAAAEFITEKISFDLIFKKPSSFIKKGFVSFISEGSEEMTSDMLTKTAERFISGDDSEIRKSINAYMQSGMTKEEATKKTIEDSIWQTLSAGLVGGVSGVAVSGVYHGFNKPQIKRVGKDIRGSADNIVKSGLDFQSNSTAYKYAQKLSKKGIGNVSDYELGLQHIYNTEQAAYEQKKAEKIAKKEANNINGEQSQNDFSDSTTQQTENVSNFDNGETINNAEQVQTDNVQAQTVNTDETPYDIISTDSVVTENNPNINNNMRNIFLKQVGDFYEAYGRNAAELADKLNLHVTKKNGQDMVGFPVSALQGYADKLNMDMQQFGDDDWSGIKLVPKETAAAANESVSNSGIAQTGANVNDNVSESAKSDIADVNKVGNTAPGTAKGISVNTNELPVKFTNVNEARREFVKYTHENFPQSVVNANTLSNIGISRTGIDKFLSGNISLQKYSTGFKIPELIESAVKVGEAENKKGKSGINGYEYYENSIKIDGENFAVHIRVRNTDMGDKYYGHTISRTVDEIKIEPLAWNSDTKSVHPINASSSDTNIVSQDADNVNNNLSESEKSDVNRSTLPEAYRYDEGGKVRFNQLDINYNNPNMRGGDFNVMQKDGSYKTVRGVLCGKYGIEKVNDNTFNIIHLQSGINPATFDTVSEAKTVVKQLNSMFDYNDVRYTKSVSEDGSEKYTLDWDESLYKYYNEIMTYIGTQTNGAVSENDTNINNNAMQTENGKKITVDMSDEERAEILKNKSINVAMVDDERTRKFENVDIDKLQSSLLRYAKPIIEKVASDFGILNKTYFNPDIELEFEYSKNSLKESMNKQQFRYGDFVKMLSVFPDVISNAVGVETHNDKYKGTTRENTSLKQMYVLASAVMDETGIIPVKLEVKEFNDRKNKLYLTVALTKKESGDLHASLGQNQLHTATPTLTISISDLVGIVNPKDGNFLKYFPDNMLDAEQIEGKRKTIEQDAKKIDKLVAGDRSVSALNNDNSANNANNRKKLYDVYRRMKDRCYNSAAKDYKYYGDKGVKVNKNWLDSFETFYRWALDNGYEDGLTIDRIDPYGDYEPSNCRWVTMSEQNRNKRSNNVENSDRVLNNRSESAIIDNSNYIDAEGAKISVDMSDEERTDLTESVNNSSDNITEVIKNTLHPGILSNSELMNELSEMFGGNGVDGLVNEVISQYNETNSLGSFERLFINNGEEVYKALQNEDKYVRFSLTDDSGYNKYTYEALTAKEDMPITVIDDTYITDNYGQLNRNKAIIKGLDNVRAKNNMRNTDTNSYVYITDIGCDVLVGKRGLSHGLSRNAYATAIVTTKIGDILENSIKVNELKPRENTLGSDVLLGFAMDTDNNPYVIRAVVNKYATSEEIESLDVLYAVNAKKKNQSSNEAELPANAVPPIKGSSTISIADLLELVKGDFSDVLTDDVLNSVNAKRSKSSLSESVVYKNNPENDNLSKKANHSKKSKLPFDEDNSGISYSLAGEKAKTADADALAKAKQMERGGASPEEIWRETGWGKGIDGKWRFEIDNSSAEFDKQGFTENPDILRKRELTDKFLNAIISDEEMRELQSLNSATNGVIKPTKLSDYFKNKELFEAYPELGDIPVRFEKLEKGTHGSYNPDTNSITLNSLDSAEKNKQTLIHEIQHSIQKQEGFAGGSSPSTAGSMAAYRNTVGEIEARDAANRMDMTAEERRTNLPESMNSNESVVSVEDGVSFSMSKSFEEQVRDVLNGKEDSNNHVYVGQTSSILKQLGLNDKPILITAGHLKDINHDKVPGISKYHGLSEEIINKLPYILNHPAIVFDSFSKNNPNAVCILSEISDGDNLPILVAIKPDGNGRYNDVRIDANFILSMYGRNNPQGFLNDMAEHKDNILYADKKRTQELLRGLRLQLPKSFSNLKFNTIIHESNNVVKKNQPKNSYSAVNSSKTINNSEVKGNGQRGNVLYRGSERSGYESAGEQIRGVQKTQFSDFGQTESERKAAAKEVLAKRQTQKQVISIGKHGIAGKVQINAINPEAYNEDMRSMVDAYAKQGIDVTLYIGDGRVAFDSHHEFRVNGFKVGNSKMYIRYDGKCSPQMLGMHEAVHIYWNNEDTISVKEYILGVLTEDEKNDILNSERYQDYMQLYNGDTEAVWQEFVADTLSGMNEFTDDFADTVNEYWNNKTELADSYRVAEYARSIDAGGGVNTDVSFATNKADLSRYEYAMVSKAVMSKNAGLSDNDLKPVDYVFAGDFCYVYENHSIGEFTVVDKLDPETDYDIIDRIMEDVKNAYNTNREVLNRWSEDIRSGERGYNRNNGRTENRRSAMGNDRLSSGKSGSDSVGYSSEDGSNKAQGKIKFSLDSNADFWEKWINKAEKYGVIPKGENPVRDVDVPKQISKKKYVSRFARTLLESGVTPDDTVSEFEKAILDGKMTYEVVSDKSAREKAEQEIKENGFAESLRDWDYIVRHGDMDKNKFAFGMQLYNQCISNKDVANAMKIAAELSAEATRAGQTIQAVRMLKQMSPDGQLYYIERSVKKLNEDFKKRLGDKFKDIQLDENLMNEFFSEKDKKKRDDIYEDICQNIADQIPATWQDKFNSWRYLAMLGNLKTHVRNVVGNAMFSLPKTVSYYISAATESASKIKTENRTKSFFKTAASKKFAEQDFKEMVKVLQGENAKYAVTTDIEGKRRIFKNGVIELFRRKNFDFLEAEDMFFLKRYYTDYLARTITARKLDVNNMSESDLYQVRMYAVKEAQAATFRDSNALAEGLSRVQHQWMNSKNAGKVAGAVLMEGTVPFKKTPLNIAKQAMNFSPLGLVRGIVSACTDLRTGKKTATEVIEILANGLTGTAIALLGAFLAHIGILVGPGDDNKKKREFDKMTGKQTFALCINGHYYTIDWMAPAVLPLFMGERIYALSKGSLSFRDIADSATTLLDPMIELSVLSGVNDLFKNAQNSGASTALSDAAISMITSYIGQIFPTLGGQLARITDNKKRNYYYIDKNSAIPKVIQKLMGNAASKILGMGKLYEPMIDAWGREITQGEIPERVLENTISPGYYSNENYTFIDRVIEDLYERTGDAAVLPTVQAKYYTDDYKRYDLTAKQWTTAQKIRGQKSLKYASDLISNKEIVNVKVNGTMVQMTWSDMNDRQKVNALSKMYKRAGDETKEEILRMMK